KIRLLMRTTRPYITNVRSAYADTGQPESASSSAGVQGHSSHPAARHRAGRDVAGSTRGSRGVVAVAPDAYLHRVGRRPPAALSAAPPYAAGDTRPGARAHRHGSRSSRRIRRRITPRAHGSSSVRDHAARAGDFSCPSFNASSRYPERTGVRTLV